jgi:hypothetical protein
MRYMVSAPTVWLATDMKMSEKSKKQNAAQHHNPTQQRHDHGRRAAPIRVKRDTDDCTRQHESASHPGLYRGGPELSEELLHVRSACHHRGGHDRKKRAEHAPQLTSPD